MTTIWRFPYPKEVTTAYSLHPPGGLVPTTGQVVTCCASLSPVTPPCKMYTWSGTGFVGGDTWKTAAMRKKMENSGSLNLERKQVAPQKPATKMEGDTRRSKATEK